MISLSAVDRQSVLSVSKVLAVLAYAFDDEFKMSSAVRNHLVPWHNASGDFLRTFGLDTKQYSKIVKALLDGNYPYDDDDVYYEAVEFASSLRPIIRTKISDDRDVDRTELAILKDFAAVALTNSDVTADKALDRIRTKVSTLNDLNLNKMFHVQIGDQDNVSTQLEKHVKKMGGSGREITPEMRKDKKGTAQLKEYNRLRRELNAVPKNFVMQLVRQSGKKYLPVRHVVEQLESAGIEHHNVAKGFVGYVDDQLKYYTKAGKLLNGTPAGDIRMNAQYDPKLDNTYVCEAKAPMAKGYSRIYTMEYKAGKVGEKFAKVADFEKKADRIRKKWLNDFKTDGITTHKGALAMLAELVYQTSGRIGGRAGKTDGEVTYGLSTLLVGHYKRKGADRLLEYKGKKAQVQKHKLSSRQINQKQLIAALDEMSSGKVRKDPLMTFNGRRLTALALNRYLKSIGIPAGVTVHKFRTLKGTKLARQILDRSPLISRRTKPTASQTSKWLKGALEKVAKELGHFNNGKLTIGTAIANYIDPSVLEDFFDKVGVRMPANVEKVVKLSKG